MAEQQIELTELQPAQLQEVKKQLDEVGLAVMVEIDLRN